MLKIIRDKKGNASVEFAMLLALVLLPLLIGVMDMADAIVKKHVLVAAVKEGAVAASKGGDPVQTVQDYLVNAGMDTAELVVDPPAYYPAYSMGSEVTVTARLTLTDFVVVPWDEYFPNVTELNAQAVRRVEAVAQ